MKHSIYSLGDILEPTVTPGLDANGNTRLKMSDRNHSGCQVGS